MEIVAHICEDGDGVQRFAEQTARLAALVTPRALWLFWVRLPYTIFTFLFFNRTSKRWLQNIRARLQICIDTESCQQCLTDIYQYVGTIRDNYMSIVNASGKLPLAGIIYRSAYKTMLMWDDLAEECLVASDAAIRDLARNIAAAA